MAVTISTLNVRLNATTAAFTSAISSAAKPLMSFGSSVVGVGSKLIGFGSALTALAAGGSLTALVSHSLEAIDANAKLADRLGMTTEGLVGLQYAGSLAGVSNEQLTTALEKMMKALGGAADDGELASNVFNKLGLDAAKLANMPADQAFTEIAQKLADIKNPAERAAAATQIFGKAGQSLLPLLMSGADGIKAAQVEAEKLGLTYNRVDAAKIEAANDAMTRARSVVEGVGNQFAISLAPYIEGAATRLKDFAIQGGGIGPKVGGAVEFVAKSVAYLSDYLNVLNAGWNILRGTGAYALGSILDVLGLVVGGVEWLYNKVTGTSSNIGNGMQVIAKSILATGDAAFKQAGENWDAFMNRTNSRAVSQAFDEMKASSDKAAQGIADNAKQMSGSFQNLEDNSKNLQKVADMLADIQKQVDQFGMTEGQKKLMDLKDLGASPEQLAQAEANLKKLSDLEDQKKASDDLAQKAKSVFDETRTPLEKYEEKLGELSDMLNAGAIDWDTYGRAIRKAQDELNSDDKSKLTDVPTLDSPDLIQSGSAQAARFSYDISRGQTQLSDSGDVPKKQLSELQDSNRLLGRIADAAEKQSTAAFDIMDTI